MDKQRLEDLWQNGVAFDTETHKFQPGIAAPPLVCGSVAHADESFLANLNEARRAFRYLLTSDDTAVLANAPFDFLVMAWDAWQRGENLMPEIFAMFQEGRVFDILTAQMLDQIAKGTLNLDPDTGGDLRDPNTNKTTNRYSLAIVEKQVLGRVTAKANDKWRFSYALLEPIPMDQWPIEARTYPIDDVVNPREIAITQAQSHENLHNLAFQVYTDWCLTLGAAHGFRVDPERIAKLKTETEQKRIDGAEKFIRAGVLRPDLSCDTKVVKRMVAKAFGATGACEACGGSQTQTSEKTGKPIICKGCDGSGLDIDSAPVPRTETGQVSKSRDTLYESGDDFLISYGEYGLNAKILSTYIPYLEKGIAEDGSQIPLTLRPNILLNTGRVSYSDVAQTFPRKGGLRECIVPRAGHVYCSCDYGGIELVSHAQSCLWLFGASKLADTLNAGKDGHSVLGAEMTGESYEAFWYAYKEAKSAKHSDYRQAAKPGNFGFPGGMGGPKLTLQQRAQGPDTTGPDGREYKGLRFCLLIGGETVCGVEKVMEWGRHTLPGPTCKHCIECAVDLKRFWMKAYPENEAYLNDYIPHVIDEYGYIIQHVSKRKRGGVDYCSAANSYFQGLTADGMKLGIQRVSAEQYTVPSSDLYGTRMILLAHDELVVEMPEEQAPAAAARLSHLMVEAMREYTPDVRVTAEPALMRRWYKGAEPVYNEDGVLIPWEPEE